MIRGSLNNQCESLRLIRLGRPVWSVCFNWLQEMPENLPFGDYRINHGLIAVSYQSVPFGAPENWSWNLNKYVIQVHYIVDGNEIIDLRDSINVKEKSSNSNENLIDPTSCSLNSLSKNDFMIIFPDEMYRYNPQKTNPSPIKKVLISIPTQSVI
jgi:beta-galactosidase beta subunit